MPHLLVAQLRFARSELVRCLDGVSEEDAVRRLMPMNCISWIVGHLAYQEHTYWLQRAQGRQLRPDLEALVGWGRPASTPPLGEMWDAWRTITAAADEYLDRLTPDLMQAHIERDGNRLPESLGTMLLRNVCHYWFHTGEAHAIRQMLGHADLPDFVGNLPAYFPEQGQ
jgi:uncharacterized damage-inducible protein DinB